MDLEQVQQLMKALEESRLKKLVLKRGDFELTLEKEGEVYVQQVAMPAPTSHALRTHVDDSDVAHRGARKPEPEGKYVTSPMVGTFYASSGPDTPAFIKVGDRVTEGTVVCIVEAMKVMNEVKAGISGTVAEVLVDNSQPIEFGSKLFRIS